jgi:hypothetical protein
MAIISRAIHCAAWPNELVWAKARVAVMPNSTAARTNGELFILFLLKGIGEVEKAGEKPDRPNLVEGAVR